MIMILRRWRNSVYRDRGDQLKTISLIERDIELNVSACLTFLEESDIATISGLEKVLPQNGHSKEIMDKLNTAYRNRQSLAFSFSEFIGSVLGKYGLFTINSCNNLIRGKSEPVFRKELLYWRDSFSKYDKTGKELLG